MTDDSILRKGAPGRRPDANGSMHLSNSWYGHAAILARYAGLDQPPPIWGKLQHGWNVATGFSPNEPPPLMRGYVWSGRNLSYARQRGLRGVTAIGAPFLYLIRMEVHRHQASLGTIAYPFHGWERQEAIGDHAALARELRVREEGDVTICLYWREYERKPLRDAYLQVGHRVICHGHREDPTFLERQLRELQKHRRVVANRVGTALWYGGILEREIAVYGPIMGLEEMSEGEEFRALQEERWPELSGTVDGSRARELAEEELGNGFVMDPGELRQALGWSSGRRALSPIVAPPLRTFQWARRAFQGW